MTFIRSKIQPPFLQIVDDMLQKTVESLLCKLQKQSKTITKQIITKQFQVNKLDVDISSQSSSSRSEF
jgi:hypothetical protein